VNCYSALAGYVPLARKGAETVATAGLVASNPAEMVGVAGGGLPSRGYQEPMRGFQSRPFSGGQPKQLTYFTPDQISNFAWSRDGKQLHSPEAPRQAMSSLYPASGNCRPAAPHRPATVEVTAS